MKKLEDMIKQISTIASIVQQEIDNLDTDIDEESEAASELEDAVNALDGAVENITDALAMLKAIPEAK